VAEVTQKIEKRRRPKRRGPLPSIEPGDRIFLTDVPTPGEAVTEPDASGDLEVTLGVLRTSINVKQIDRVEKLDPDAAATDPALRRSERGVKLNVEPESLKVSPELDLRGLTVDEALILVDQRIDEASQSGVTELRVIHGKGTGVLRRAVRESLSRNALVRSHATADRKNGGDGVTVVELTA
jgi:DNA mismatch repair protein MutS2